MVLSNRSLTPPRGSFGSMTLYPSPSTSTPFYQGLVDEIPSHNLFDGSLSMRPSQTYLHSGAHPLVPNDLQLLPAASRPVWFDSSSVLNSFPVLHPEPSPFMSTRHQSGNPSSLLSPSEEPPHLDFTPRSVAVDTGPRNLYPLDNGLYSSSEFPYHPSVIPMQVATEPDGVNPQIVRNPYIFPPPSFPMPMETNIVHSDLSTEATDLISPFAYNTNFLPMASNPTQGSLVYNRFQDLGNDYHSPEESGLEEFWTATPDALAAHSYEMLNQPSVEFIRQTWWESLTRHYGGPRVHATRHITTNLSHLCPSLQLLCCIVRCLLHSILEDVRMTLFPSSINVPLFFSTLQQPGQREHVQPSLVVAMLALSTLLQSSDIGLGHQGRLKACEFPSMRQWRMLH
ncbi:hypothetical protein BS47DRAFT_1085425 [Hydnum rufescens UP504]|uniref:Uncharacterized protein n=1 Tax=Hydnum rufescens UP504 TaxID=1448309 RepID=A0A9P6B8Z6_9AGAM|nr:hypothetical protein BS47DRAFT_1085425 [Hydnum rufescens UP504]